MLALLRHLRERWSNWCGDRDMELAIRQQLTDSGYYGRTAKLMRVRVVAIKRPGWVQIYQFDAQARLQQDDEAQATDVTLFGLVHDDGRSKSRVFLFPDTQTRLEKFTELSADMLVLRNSVTRN